LDPTNNAAERAIRPAGQATRFPKCGSVFVARMLITNLTGTAAEMWAVYLVEACRGCTAGSIASFTLPGQNCTPNNYIGEDYLH